MPANLHALLSLQDIDLATDARRAAVAAAREELADDSPVTKARVAVEEASAQLSEAQARGREAEQQVADSEARIAPLEAKLYDGSIKNPKELQELDHQVHTFKEMHGELEGVLLERMAEVDAASSALGEGQAALAEAERSRAEAVERLTGEIAKLDREIAELEEQRAGIASGLDPAVLRLYELLRPRTGGRAVARVERGMCNGCRITLPVTVVTRARSGTAVAQCTSCQRILLAG